VSSSTSWCGRASRRRLGHGRGHHSLSGSRLSRHYGQAGQGPYGNARPRQPRQRYAYRTPPSGAAAPAPIPMQSLTRNKWTGNTGKAAVYSWLSTPGRAFVFHKPAMLPSIDHLSQENAQFSHLESFGNITPQCYLISLCGVKSSKMMSSGRISSYLYLWVAGVRIRGCVRCPGPSRVVPVAAGAGDHLAAGEKLTDRQASESVRTRIDWRYRPTRSSRSTARKVTEMRKSRRFAAIGAAAVIAAFGLTCAASSASSE